MGRKHMTREQREECIRMYADEGFTLLELAGIYDRHITIINRLIKRADVKRGHKFRNAFKKTSIRRRRHVVRHIATAQESVRSG